MLLKQRRYALHGEDPREEAIALHSAGLRRRF
jgi:hypothetical protein